MNPSLATIDQVFCYQFSTEYLKSWFIKDLFKFVNKHNILYSSQYGFRCRHSTQQATLEILNDILSNFEKGQFTFCLLLDLKNSGNSFSRNYSHNSLCCLAMNRKEIYKIVFSTCSVLIYFTIAQMSLFVSSILTKRYTISSHSSLIISFDPHLD